MRRFSFAVAVVVLFSGCAIGRRHAYNQATPRLGYRGTSWVALAVQDRRYAVVSGKKAETFVGFSRGGYGNTFDVNTVSQQPLATDFGHAVWRGLAAGGYRVTFVTTSPRQSAELVSSELRRSGAPRALFIEINEWHSDTYNRTQLIFDVSARVLDAATGQQIATASISGRDVLGGSFMDPGGHAQDVIPAAFNERLEGLLNRPELIHALQDPPAAAPPPAGPAPTAAPATAVPAPAS